LKRSFIGFAKIVLNAYCEILTGLVDLEDNWDPEKVSWRKEDGKILVGGLVKSA